MSTLLRYLRRLTVLALTLCMAGLAIAADPIGPLTMEQAVALALQNNPTITLAAQDVTIAEAQLRAAHANRLPDINASVNATYNPSPGTLNVPGSDVSISSDPFSSTARIGASQPVWPPARWRAPIRSAQAGVQLSEEELTRTRQQIAFQTRQAFVQLLTAQELRAVAQDAVTVAQRQLQLAQVQVEAGVAARVDVFQAEAVLADAQVSLAQAENSVDLSRAALATQIGFPADTPVEIVPTQAMPAVPEAVDPLVTLALQQRPELRQLNARREQARANIERIRTQQQPVVNIEANYSQDLTNGFSLTGGSGLTFGASAALNIYNGGQTRAELAAARTQLEQIDTTARQIELNVALQVRQAWQNMQNATRQLSAAQRQLTAAEEALRISRLRYEAGEGIILEVEQAQLRRTQALTSVAQARFQAQLAAAQLQLALGTPVTMPEPSGNAAPPAEATTPTPQP